MRLVISTRKIKEFFVFLLPALSILLQWVSVAGINFSWLLSVYLMFTLLMNGRYVFSKKIPTLILLIAVVIPLFNFWLGNASSFNISLYISVLTGVVFMLYISSLNDSLYYLFLKGGLFACVLFAVWGIYEVVTGHYILSNHEYFTQGMNWNNTHYPVAAFPNTNDIAQFLVMLFPVSSFSLLKKNKLAWAITTILVFFVVYASGSRLCMISFVIVWLLTLCMKLVMNNKADIVFKLILFIAAICVGLFVVDARTGLVTSVIENFLIVNSNADYYTGRSEIYNTVFATALKLPFGGFGSAYEAYYMPPHNLFLFIMCDYGWIPVLLFVFLLLKFAVSFWEGMKHDLDNLNMFLLFSSICVFPILSCISSTNEQRKIVWMILGIMLNRYYYLKSEKHLIDNTQKREYRIET